MPVPASSVIFLVNPALEIGSADFPIKEIADNVVADVEFDIEDCAPLLDGLEETAIKLVGGTRVVVVIVRGGGLGRFPDMVGGASLSRSLCE